MGAAFLDEGDACPAAPAEGAAETGDQLDPRGGAAYDPDMMEPASWFRTGSGAGAFVETSSRVDLSSGMLRSQRYRSTRIVAPEAFEQTPRLARRCVSS
jgi:hypothetical protein